MRRRHPGQSCGEGLEALRREVEEVGGRLLVEQPPANGWALPAVRAADLDCAGLDTLPWGEEIAVGGRVWRPLLAMRP